MTVAGLHLRLARPGDLSAVDALFAHSYARLIRADYPPSVLVTAVPRLARAQPALLASGRYWLAETEGGSSPPAAGARAARQKARSAIS